MSFKLENFADVPGFPYAMFLVWLLGAVVHIFFALGTYIDAKAIFERRSGPFLVIPFIWALTVLMGGIAIVAVYWVIHHSTLRYRGNNDPQPL